MRSFSDKSPSNASSYSQNQLTQAQSIPQTQINQMDYSHFQMFLLWQQQAMGGQQFQLPPQQVKDEFVETLWIKKVYGSLFNRHIKEYQDYCQQFSDYEIPLKFTSPLYRVPSVFGKQSYKKCQILVHLELEFFKTNPCNKTSQHNHKQCINYHNPKDRRRPGNFYSSELCGSVEQENYTMKCAYGDLCTRAHNKVEAFYKTDKYKTKFCTYYPYNCANCDYGEYCCFAHSEEDIMIELLHNMEYDEDFYIFYYKTVWCPFNYIQHDRGLCVYAHNYQDYRRKPFTYRYQPFPCQNWNPNQFLAKYDDACMNKMQCNKCHGWKEFEYHPLLYKTKPCTQRPSCSRGSSCPYFHNSQDRRQQKKQYLKNRVFTFQIQNQLFTFVPQNRIVKNIFKLENSENDFEQIEQIPVKKYPIEKEADILSIEQLKEIEKQQEVSLDELYGKQKKKKKKLQLNPKQSQQYPIDQVNQYQQ